MITFKQLTALSLFLSFVIATPLYAAITRNLSLGDRGEDVRELQVLLNRDARTQLATSGSGSPGNETDYFGTLTLDAVKRFQAVHASSVLAPVGVSTPTGFVGPSTRAQLDTPQQQSTAGTNNIPAPINNEASSYTQATPFVDNTFLETLPQSAEGAVQYAKENKEYIVNSVISNMRATLSSDEEAQVREMVEKGIDDLSAERLEEFYDEAFSQSGNTLSTEDLLNIADLLEDEEFVEAAEASGASEEMIEEVEGASDGGQSGVFKDFFAGLFAPQQAAAQTGLLPFGGFVFPFDGVCTCYPLVVRVLIVHPSSATVSGLFDYHLFTQMHLWFNFPYSTYATGLYVPFVSVTCWAYVGVTCFPVPGSYGLITPHVGTSI